MKKIFKTLIILFLILPNLIFAQAPETLEGIGRKILEALKEFPKILANIFKEEVLPFWKRIWEWFKENVWQRIVNWIKIKFEKLKKSLFDWIKRVAKRVEEYLNLAKIKRMDKIGIIGLVRDFSP